MRVPAFASVPLAAFGEGNSKLAIAKYARRIALALSLLSVYVSFVSVYVRILALFLHSFFLFLCLLLSSSDFSLFLVSLSPCLLFLSMSESFPFFFSLSFSLSTFLTGCLFLFPPSSHFYCHSSNECLCWYACKYVFIGIYLYISSVCLPIHLSYIYVCTYVWMSPHVCLSSPWYPSSQLLFPFLSLPFAISPVTSLSLSFHLTLSFSSLMKHSRRVKGKHEFRFPSVGSSMNISLNEGVRNLN